MFILVRHGACSIVAARFSALTAQIAALARGASFVLLALLVNMAVSAAPPELYRDPAHESPVRADPDDLLLLAGYGLAADDSVVYRAVPKSPDALATPSRLPSVPGAEMGLAPVVSSADVPYSLTVKLPQSLRADQAYALWVRTSRGEWSKPVKINDARPLWVSPAYVFASQMPGYLPREIKIVGRNLQSGPGHTTQIRLLGPQPFTGTALADSHSSDTLNHYVARLQLPARMTPGEYRIEVDRDGTGWVAVGGQTLEVLPDPVPTAQFSVSDQQFGGCRPNDGTDDTVCILRAIAAAERAGGGEIYFAPGTWDLIDGSQPGLAGDEGILLPPGVELHGAGSSVTRLVRHADWNAHAPTVAFTVTGRTRITGFTFRDLQVYQPRDRAGAFFQLGEDWQRAAAASVTAAPGAAHGAVVGDVVITRNVFDKPIVAISSAGLPINRLFITYNTFGAYSSALELSGDQYDMIHKFRLDDTVIDYNLFEPSSKLSVIDKTGPLASEVGAGLRVDFSGNTADGTSRDFLYAADDPKGWSAAFFWNPNNNVEEVLVSQNTATCTGDKIGDGEAISFDNNTNTFAFSSAPTVVESSASAVAVAAPLIARQHERDVPLASYYIGHWVQIVSGPGLGQVRKITGYSTDPRSHVTTFSVAPAWDAVPVKGRTRIAVGREYWQLYVLDNHVDNRQPLCQKSNRSRRVGGAVGLWAQTADTVFAGNRQYDSDGIFAQEVYGAANPPCPDCAMTSFFNYFLEIRDNLVDGEYDWANDCSRSGIGIGVGAASWGEAPPPTVSFGVSIAHNTVIHADEQYGGAISQVNTWLAGPEPSRWPLSDSLLIHHNSISNIDGTRAMPICGTSRPRIGISFPDPAIAWRTVLYANSCKSVSTPLGSGGIDTVKVCPSSAPDSCECP